MLYATARRGYRAGGYNVPLLNPMIADAQTFAPEVLDDIEIGSKGAFVLGTMRGNFTVAGFRGKIKGSQAFVVTAGVNPAILPAVGLTLNKNDYTQKGFEGALDISPMEGLWIGGNVSYIKPKLEKFTLPSSLTEIYRAAGQLNTLTTFALSLQPTWQANANISYTARDVVGGADLFIGADLHYQSKYGTFPRYVPGYKNVDARVGLRGLHNDTVDLTLWVKNIFDQRYYFGSSAGGGSLGTGTYLPAPPRTFGASARYTF